MSNNCLYNSKLTCCSLHFKKYNVSYPKSGWNYDEFVEIAKKLTHKPEIYGISFEEEPLFYLWILYPALSDGRDCSGGICIKG